MPNMPTLILWDPALMVTLHLVIVFVGVVNTTLVAWFIFRCSNTTAPPPPTPAPTPAPPSS